LPFYHGIFSACFFFSTVRHRRSIASGATPLMSIWMVHFMQELKCADDFPRKEASGRERENEQESKSDAERETFFKVARAREYFPP
jgi:hypothetical protein